MKAKTRMIVASAVVIAFALTAASGITYSWFSDTEKSEISITTAKIDYDVTWGEYVSEIGTTATANNGKITIDNLVANANIPVITGITNGSTVKTVYRIYATAGLTEDHNYTLYDLKNIYIGGKQLNATGSADDNNISITLGETPIVDWTLLNADADPSTQIYSITVDSDYGGSDVFNKVVAYDPETGTGYTSKELEEMNIVPSACRAWSQGEVKEGLTISLTVVAAQGDYPYQELTQDPGAVTVSAIMPPNKVVKTASITSSESGSIAAVKDVVVDFSSVGGSDGTTDVSDTKVTVGVSKIDTEKKQINVSFALTDSEGNAIEKPTFDNPVVMTMTVPGEMANPEVKYNGDGNDGTVLSSIINSDGTTTITFSVDHFSEYTIVNTNVVTSAEGLVKVLAADESYVKLGADISVDKSIDLTRDITLDLNGKTITFVGEDEADVNWNIKIDNNASVNVYGTEGSSIVFSKTWGFRVVNGNLTIDGDAEFVGASFNDTVVIGTRESTGSITVNSGNFVSYNAGVAVYAYDGPIVINGGTFTYCEGEIDTSCGKLLNQNNDNPGTITVKAGTFMGYDPSTGDDNLGGNFVAEGCSENVAVYPAHFTGFTGSNAVVDNNNTQYATISAALSANTGENDLVLYCKPGAEITENCTMTVSNNLTIYGYGATVIKGEFTLDDSEITLNVYRLNGCSIYDVKTSAFSDTITLNFKDCQNMHRVRIEGQYGTVNTTIIGCSFIGDMSDLRGYETAVKFDPIGQTEIINTLFKDYILGINMKNDGITEGNCHQEIIIKGCTFTDCGTVSLVDTVKNHGNHYEDFATAIRIVAAEKSANTMVTMTDITFEYSENNEVAIADIILGDSRSLLGPVSGKNNYGTITVDYDVVPQNNKPVTTLYYDDNEEQIGFTSKYTTSENVTLIEIFFNVTWKGNPKNPSTNAYVLK